jgi:hypothetical protein
MPDVVKLLSRPNCANPLFVITVLLNSALIAQEEIADAKSS